MRRLPIHALLLLAACAGTPESLPDASIDTRVHPEYDRIRPVVLALEKVDDRFSHPTLLRRTIYDGLFSKRYSPLKLSVIDAHTSVTTGRFEGDRLSWDARLHVVVDRFESAHGGDNILADATAQLIHKNGEQLWECKVASYALDAEGDDGGFDEEGAVEELAFLFLKRLPDAPPPRE